MICLERLCLYSHKGKRMPTNFVIREGRIEFAVEAILDHYIGSDTTYFKILWKGERKVTWEPLQHLRCPMALHRYAVRKEQQRSVWPPSGQNRTDSGTLGSTLDLETAHSRTLARSLTGSWIRSRHGTRSDTSSSEASRWVITPPTTTTTDSMCMSHLSSIPLTPEGRSSTTSDSLYTQPDSLAPTTLASETLSSPSQVGENITQKRRRRSQTNTSPTSLETLRRNTRANFSRRENQEN